MITLFRGPGGPFRRTLAEIVPLGCACVAGGLFLTLAWTLPTWIAVPSGLLTGALTWAGCSYAIRAFRRRPQLRRIYRLAVLGHVLFWSALGLLASTNEGAGPLEDGGTSGWSAPAPFLAGAAQADFALPAHATLAGWGQRPRRLTFPPNAGLGVLGRFGQAQMAMPQEAGGAAGPLFRRPDPDVASQVLGARAVVLRPEDPATGAPVAIVRVDLVTVGRHLHAEVVKDVLALGIRPEGLLLAASHTHSGPGGYSKVPLSAVIGTDHFDQAVFDTIKAACVSAVRKAHADAVPARLSLVRARDRDAAGKPLLSRNRRKADGDRIDDRAYGLRIDARDSGEAIAFVLNYAVHPTLLRRRHLGFHRDLAGALEDAARDALPGTPLVLFVNGAQGDISSQHVPASPTERAKVLAERFTTQALLPAVTAAPSAGRTLLRVACARVRRRMPTARLVKGWGGREATLDALYDAPWEGGVGKLAAEVLSLPLNAFVWSMGVPELRFGFSWKGAFGFSANLDKGTGTEPYDVGAFVFETTQDDGSASERWALLWQPGEATQAVGRAWRDRVAAIGIADTLLVGLAGGATAYITTEDEFHQDGYESVATLFGPTAHADITEALLEALIRAGDAR